MVLLIYLSGFGSQMEIQLTMIDSRRAGTKKSAGKDLLRDYTARLEHFCRFQQIVFSTEAAFTAAERSAVKTPGRTQPYLILLDNRGKQMSSEALAKWLGRQQDAGTQRLIFAVGPADGWSDEVRKRANLLLSLGPMTLPHELAAIVLAEQIYRAFTILKGLPYHLGHA